MKDNKTYYDDFAGWYERERHGGYHALIDQLQVELVQGRCAGKEVLEVGCGTGMILREIAPVAERAVGIDISPGMLEQAKARGLDVLEGSATDLPFEDDSFDVVYSFKVLAHVEEIERALSEVGRVLRPGGVATLEFYNPRSLRGLIKRLKRPTAVSEQTHDEEVYTRYDTLEQVQSYLPDTLTFDRLSGVRIFTPFALVHKIPLIAQTFRGLERWGRDRSSWARWGGFMVVHLSCTKSAQSSAEASSADVSDKASSH